MQCLNELNFEKMLDNKAPQIIIEKESTPQIIIEKESAPQIIVALYLKVYSLEVF